MNIDNNLLDTFTADVKALLEEIDPVLRGHTMGAVMFVLSHKMADALATLGDNDIHMREALLSSLEKSVRRMMEKKIKRQPS